MSKLSKKQLTNPKQEKTNHKKKKRESGKLSKADLEKTQGGRRTFVGSESGYVEIPSSDL